MWLLLWTVLACDPGAAEAGPADANGAGARLADVQAVSASGAAGSYTFAITIKSPDTGCDQFADWWEVASTDGELVYRRVLLHSHVDEQPFTRTGGPVSVQADDTVIVRAHLSTGGYGGTAMRGSVSSGFTVATDIGGDWAADLATEQPLPTGCAF